MMRYRQFDTFTAMSVKARDLSKVYGNQTAVDHISLEVRPGEILGFLGPNGAGKSTTMKMLTGFLPVSSGSVSVVGIDMLKNPLEGRKHIGYLPESNPLYYDMYVREYLAFTASVYGISSPKSAIDRVVEMTGLGPEQNKIIRQLSKGYKQRVGLAQALIHDPEVLILDEPTSGFDPVQLLDIRNLIKSLGKGKTIIFSTHIMQEVQAVCSRVVIINKGKLVADDTVEGLSQRINGGVAVNIAFERRPSADFFRNNSIITASSELSNGTFRVSGKDLLALKKELFQLAVAANNPILSLSDEKADLEHIFTSLTQSPQ